MKNNLPYLTPERLNFIFGNVYSANEVKLENDHEPEKLQALLTALKAAQDFNYRYRPDDLAQLFPSMSRIFHFELNSDGTSIWLGLILAIKELYGFSDTKIIEVMRMVRVRK